MFDDKKRCRQAARWIVSVVTVCILIYLGLRHIGTLAKTIGWLAGLVKPLLIGAILALILNVPMSMIESRFLKKAHYGKRPLAILLALLLVSGIFVGVAFLVIPELFNAVALIAQIVEEGLEQLESMDIGGALAQTPLAEWLDTVDWLSLKIQLETWFKEQSGTLVNRAMGAAGFVVSGLATSVVGLIFAIYILAGKEKLKRQASRLMRVWLPAQISEGLIHVASVCGSTFKLFIAGQATEAIILGTLCMLGMMILRLPYAPMIGALVGVTALIPVVGAFVGTIVGTIMILTVSPFKAMVFVIYLLILQQIEGNVIYPRVVGSKISLPAIWVLAAVTVGGNLAGPIGMLLGVPAFSAAYALIKEATDHRTQRLHRNKKRNNRDAHFESGEYPDHT